MTQFYAGELLQAVEHLHRLGMVCLVGTSVSDPDSIRSVDPYPDPDSESGQKLPTKVGKSSEISCFEVLDVFF